MVPRTKEARALEIREARRALRTISLRVNRPYGTCEAFGEIRALKDAVMHLTYVLQGLERE